MKLSTVLAMAHSPMFNYIVPGLTSWLVGGHPSDTGRGCTRLFTCDSNNLVWPTPHSHRFNFEATVLQGEVINRIYVPTDRFERSQTERYQSHLLPYLGNVGKYGEPVENGEGWYTHEDMTYTEDDTYYMRAAEIHSIHFARGTAVLMMEEPSLADQSEYIIPTDGVGFIDTMKSEPWMFQRGSLEPVAALNVKVGDRILTDNWYCPVISVTNEHTNVQPRIRIDARNAMGNETVVTFLPENIVHVARPLSAGQIAVKNLQRKDQPKKAVRRA